ncbi:MAG: hypothetical protein HND58_08625 [Planctomycetota bacterium]|nr:MAG: hypothetical protein HND58_08625 [Planctomycetota bacterium]
MARTPGHDSPNHNDAQDALRVVTLVHGRHRWRFSCHRGEERSLVTAVAKAALKGQGGLDLADAAILARRLDAWPAPGTSHDARPDSGHHL